MIRDKINHNLFPPNLIKTQITQPSNNKHVAMLKKTFSLTASALLLIGLVASVNPLGLTNEAYAAPKPPILDLNISGPQTAKVNQELTGINIKLKAQNASQDAPDSRLRLFIHDGTDRNLNFGDIRIDVKEGGNWQPLQVELIDAGVIATIGAEGKHKENHKRGGFKITKNFNNVWQIRIIFAQPGQYQLVVAVSPDNGSSHLAQPIAYNLEAI